jgi:hypothetical protein
MVNSKIQWATVDDSVVKSRSANDETDYSLQLQRIRVFQFDYAVDSIIIQ